MNIKFLTTTEVLLIHKTRIEKYGGSFGVRDQHLLDSALSMPKSGFGDTFFHETIFLMAAAYLFHIAKNHPFVDGNKRTALASCLIFLQLNGYILTAKMIDLETLVINTATGKTSKDDIAKFLKKHCIKTNANQ